MKRFIIHQKMSGTGTIHDIAADTHDREIAFRNGCKYAVVLAAYYGYNIYTTHRSAEAAIRAANKNHGYSLEIIDDEGNFYIADTYSNQLVRR